MYLPFFSFCVCPMCPRIPFPFCLLYMLELSLKRLAILLDCAVVLKTQRIAPVCIGVASLPLSLPFSSPFPVQAEIYAHMLSTLFALKGGWVCSHFGGWLLVLSLAKQYEGLLLLLLSCLPVWFPLLPFFQLFACFGIFPTRFCLFSKLKLI